MRPFLEEVIVNNIKGERFFRISQCKLKCSYNKIQHVQGKYVTMNKTKPLPYHRKLN